MELGAVRHNVRHVLSRLPAGARLIAVVKANAYGHGALEVGRAALEAGAWGLGVSTPAEAAALAELAGPDRRLALGGLSPGAAAEAVGSGCALTVHGAELLDALEQATPAGRRTACHLKVDTGMGRLGCDPAEAPALARRIARSSRLRLAGVFTHFAASESDEAFTREQFDRFLEVLDCLGVDPGLRHAANSGAALRHPEMALDAVRCGIALYGCEWPGLRPALRLCARVTQVKPVAPGGTVGYGRAWRAGRPSRVAVVGIGYEDGVLRARANRGHLMVEGRPAPLIGRVSMDQLTVDVTDVPEAAPGSVALLIGEGIRAEQVAEWSGTISYEVLTAIGNRVSRRFRE